MRSPVLNLSKTKKKNRNQYENKLTPLITVVCNNVRSLKESEHDSDTAEPREKTPQTSS